ncbi:hypothetical protein E4U61_003463 [Claviceps capensis]|nr:hypothetical protein E4U61_003463 [Claviceps capensis]
MASLHSFTHDQEAGIDAAWTKLKEIRRKIIGANPEMTNAYHDSVLFILLTTALQKQGRILQEKEAQLLVSNASKERANSARRQTGTYRHPNHHTRRASNSSDEGKSGECYCCGSTKHLVSDCPFQDAMRVHARNMRMKMEGKLHKWNGKTSNSRRSKKDTKFSSRRRKHGHSAACESDSTDTEPNSEDSDSDDDSDTTERVMLSKESIRKSTPETDIQDPWLPLPADRARTPVPHRSHSGRSTSRLHRRCQHHPRHGRHRYQDAEGGMAATRLTAAPLVNTPEET